MGIPSKNSNSKKNFYFMILSSLKSSTNLSNISKKLGISKQNLNYYIRQLLKSGKIIKKGYGCYNLGIPSKNSTMYGSNLPQDFIRGHAFVIQINLPKIIKNWEKREEILKFNNIHYVLVGLLKNIPRIKVLGRKIWLCNTHLRIFDKPNASYYGINAIESKGKALAGILEVISAIENKLKISLKPYDFTWKKEHFSLIKNDLAIDQNKKGIIWRISDETGEWLLVDDSLEQGGELENVGKDAFMTNLPMQKWWNNQKETKFQVTPNFVLESFSKLQNALLESQKQLLEYKIQNKKHLSLINQYRKENIAWRKNQVQKITKKIKSQTKLSDF